MNSEQIETANKPGPNPAGEGFLEAYRREAEVIRSKCYENMLRGQRCGDTDGAVLAWRGQWIGLGRALGLLSVMEKGTENDE